MIGRAPTKSVSHKSRAKAQWNSTLSYEHQSFDDAVLIIIYLRL